MRYYVKCKLNSKQRQRLADSISSGSLAKGKIFYEGIQSALREATLDEKDIVHFVEICYCLEGGLYPMAMEIPVLKENFEEILEIKDARLRNQCTMECEFCDCTRAIKLPGKSLLDELHVNRQEEEEEDEELTFVDIGRIKLNRRKQREGLEELKNISNNNNFQERIKPIFAGAAISGLFVIFYNKEDHDYFRIKNILDSHEARQVLSNIFNLIINDSTENIKTLAARSSLAQSDKRSNVV